jgi:hypothetical protein
MEKNQKINLWHHRVKSIPPFSEKLRSHEVYYRYRFSFDKIIGLKLF